MAKIDADTGLIIEEVVVSEQSTKPNQIGFEDIKRINEYGQEVWSARELSKALGYSDYRNFLKAVEQAKIACGNSGQVASDHIVEVNNMVEIGSGARRNIDDLELSRYASYICSMNCDPSKIKVSEAQNYFATNTRQNELNQQISGAHERLTIRQQVSNQNNYLNEVISEHGATSNIDYGMVHNASYQGFYGNTLKEVKEKKGIPKNSSLLDNVSSLELAYNQVRILQTAETIRNTNCGDIKETITVANQVGGEVREFVIRMNNGVPPEDLPKQDHIRLEKRVINKMSITKRTPKKLK